MSGSEHTLAFLLAFNGRVHHYADGYFVKFEIRQVEPTKERPHGLRYSFTLHGPGGERLIGFDNAHAVAPLGSRYKKKPVVTDHWHRGQDDEGRPYIFESAEKLVDDFFDEVERVLVGHGVSLDVVKVEDRSNE
ncbi:toxin-antitoxin system TumE family protein [Devosia nitrariae]|uniref:Uncharacterized protein n=1 Tax=Devosia nitrariae TaxID=2071872 RepID=A0ABQ5WBF3_9HYPH|nr:DUF6516 family protein [Devosia nitrariae]GLQ57124.1 hypothetical protein GCM10010862_43830 [Devosia nitrariae]